MTVNKLKVFSAPTPSYEGVPPEECSLVGKSENQKGLKKQAFHEEPEEIGQDTVLEECHRSLTPHLTGRTHCLAFSILFAFCLLNLFLIYAVGHIFDLAVQWVLSLK